MNLLLPKLLIAIGLILNIAGAGLMARDLILTKLEAVEMAAFHQPGGSEHEKRRLLDVNAVLNKSRNAQVGVVLMVIGFCAQLIGTLLW